MKPETRHTMYVLTGGEAGVTILTIIMTISFLESGLFEIIRNVIIGDLLFLAAYWGWIKVYAYYKKMYKLGLGK
jgi:hypothetical protein